MQLCIQIKVRVTSQIVQHNDCDDDDDDRVLYSGQNVET